jgi:hypothetical protein
MRSVLLVTILLYCASAVAQPVWSPHALAERENKWMRDSLLLPVGKLEKALNISESYYTTIQQNEQNMEMQAKADKKKDARMKPLLTSQQYQRYYRREQELRQARKARYHGKHQPY